MENSIEPKADSTAKHVAQDEAFPPTIEQTEVTQSNDNRQPNISHVETANQNVIDAGQKLDDKSLTPDNLTVTVTYNFIFVLSFLFSVSLKIHLVLFNRLDRIKFFRNIPILQSTKNQNQFTCLSLQTISTFFFFGGC